MLPDMALWGCKTCIFLVNEISHIEEEIDLWTAEFMKYFKVKKVFSYVEALEHIGKQQVMPMMEGR